MTINTASSRYSWVNLRYFGIMTLPPRERFSLLGSLSDGSNTPQPTVRGEADRRCRFVLEPCRERGGVVHGREDLGSGIGPHPGLVADEEGPGGHDDQRLQEAWHHNVVRCPQCPGWHRDRLLHGPASPRRVPEIRAHHRQASAQRPCGPYDSGQLRHPQTPGRAGLARQASPVPPALHPNLKLLVEPRRAVVPRTDRQSHPSTHLPFRARPDRRDRDVHGGPQRRAQAAHLDRDSRIQPDQSPSWPSRTQPNSQSITRHTTSRIARSVHFGRSPLASSQLPSPRWLRWLTTAGCRQVIATRGSDRRT